METDCEGIALTQYEYRDALRRRNTPEHFVTISHGLKLPDERPPHAQHILEIRIARGRPGRPQGVESFVADLNSLLAKEDQIRSTTLWRWEQGQGTPNIMQGIALAALDPEGRDVYWLAGQEGPSPVVLKHRPEEQKELPPAEYVPRPVPRPSKGRKQG